MGKLRVSGVLASLLIGLVAQVPAATLASTSFNPVADAFVAAEHPVSNYGSRAYLRTDASPVRIGYLRFDVQGVGPASSARLRIYFESGSKVGVSLHSVADVSWGETTITYNDRPALGPLIDSRGPFTSGSWLDFDVSSAVTGDGPVGFALTTTASTAFTATSREGTNKPQLLVPAPPSPSPYVISRVGTTYQAISETNGTTFSGSLKSVVEAAAGDLRSYGGGTIRFGVDTYDLGTEFFKLRDASFITFEGSGMDQTTIQNNTSASADTEPFNFSGASHVIIRDMTIAAGGALRSTSDAIDFDRGNDSLVERVRIIASRARGIVFDGKNAGWTADRNIVRDCVITGVDSHGIQFLASSQNRVEGCTIIDVGGYGIQITKASASADQPNKKSNDNVITGNVIQQAGQDGININSSDRNLISGNTILNSSDEVSGRDGIRINSADSIACDDNAIENNVATDDQAIATQRYGLSISSSRCNRTIVRGNDFTGNAVGEINDLGTDTQIETTPDTEAPSIPTGVVASVISSSQLDVDWTPSTDDVGVTGYTIYRDGAFRTTVAGSILVYHDTSVLPETTYSYTVDAFDAGGNHSAQSSPPATATTPSGPTSLTLNPIADAYVDSSTPTTNRGALSSLRVDGSPEVRSYLRFDIQGLSGTVVQATLRLYANSGSSVGFDTRGVSDTSWGEMTITFENAPALGSVVGSSGPFTSGAYREADVTALVTGNGLLSIAATTTSGTAVSLGSRESSTPPELVILTSSP